MKIVHITSMHSWNDDRIFQRACVGLARLSHEVTLIATESKDFVSNGVEIKHIKHRSGFSRRVMSSIEACRIAALTKADIYHFHDPDLLPFIGFIKRKNPKGIILYDIHENYSGRFRGWRLPSFLAGFLEKRFKIYEKRIIQTIDGFTVVSESMRNLFSGINKPSIVVRNSADVYRLKSLEINQPEKFSKRTIYTSGTNSDARQCLETVKALPSILSKHPDVSMMFAGSYIGDIEERMKDQAHIDRSENHLFIEGNLPWLENFKRTAKAFCGCVFYSDTPNNRVGIPNRLFEYMYCSIPIIASDFPELRKIISEVNCGILVNSDDPASIAEGINFLLDNPEMALEMGKRGRNAVENTYGYHIDLKNLVNFYESLITN